LKFNKLKYGNENVPLEEQKSTSNDAQHFNDGLFWDEFNLFLLLFLYSDENREDPNLAFGGSSVSFKQGRQLLRQ